MNAQGNKPIYCNNCSEEITTGEYCDFNCERQFEEMEGEYYDAQYRAELLNEKSFEDTNTEF